MSRMHALWLGVVAAGLLTGCNTTPSADTGYWPDWKRDDSLNNKALAGDANRDVFSGSAATSATAPASTYELEPVPAVDLNPQPAPQPVQPAFQQPAYQPSVRQPAPAPAARGTTYTVKRGDTLWHISRRQYGSALYWKDIADANPNIDPNKLQLGQKLILPPLAAAGGARATNAAPVRGSNTAVNDDAQYK